MENEAKEKVIDVHEFDTLIDDYQAAQLHGSSKLRVDSRRALLEAYRAALRAAGLPDR